MQAKEEAFACQHFVKHASVAQINGAMLTLCPAK